MEKRGNKMRNEKTGYENEKRRIGEKREIRASFEGRSGSAIMATEWPGGTQSTAFFFKTIT